VRLRDASALVVLVLVVFGAGSLLFFTLKLGISPMPTSAKVRAAMLSLLPTNTRGVVHELGAGWGGLALALARHCPDAHVVAWEVSWVPFAVAAIRARLARLPNLEVRRADFFAGNLGEAHVLVCYLFTGAMRRLDTKLRREFASAPLVVITNTFLLHGWPQEKALVVDDFYRSRVVRYQTAQSPGPKMIDTPEHGA
jgi:hypothetical protein